tara:strand:- start:973 stop:1209 length:237 start_codon:yes stop_codon:yes gene_type:complete
MITIGDKIMWRGGFGKDAPKVATVTGLELTQEPREKYGEATECSTWERARENRLLVTLDNGHWCYGSQISPLDLSEEA